MAGKQIIITKKPGRPDNVEVRELKRIAKVKPLRRA